MESLKIDMVFLSPAFSVMFIIIAVAFVTFVGIAVYRNRRLEEMFHQIPSSNGVTRHDGDLVMRRDGELVRLVRPGVSYQKQISSNSNSMTENKLCSVTQTYRVLDSRLLDE